MLRLMDRSLELKVSAFGMSNNLGTISSSIISTDKKSE